MNLCTQCKHYGRGPYAVVEVCLLEEFTRDVVNPVNGYRTARKTEGIEKQSFKGKLYQTCYSKREAHPNCPDFEARPPIKWWQIWRWGE